MAVLIEDVKRSLDVLFQPGDTIELRCVGNRTISGFYRDPIKLAADAEGLNSTFNPPENCYVCLNPCRPDLFGRRADSFSLCKKGEAVGDSDVRCRTWLLVDIDAVRPSAVSATDVQKQAAVDLGKQVYAWLQEQTSASCLVCADSGNGVHILIRLPDVANDEQSRWVCERFLQLLSDQFSTEQAKVDTTTYNSARICTLYGTMKRKGSDTDEQPHRLSKIVHVPDSLQPVDWPRLSALVDPYPGYQEPQRNEQQSTNKGQGWNIEQLLEERQIEFSRDGNYRTNSGKLATRWELKICPFNADHNDRSAVILQWSNGAVCFKCHHDGCSDNDWQALKQRWQLPDGNGITASDIKLPKEQQRELLIVRSLDIQPEHISWLSQDRFVIGGINLCAGRGGIGKTYFLCDFVARISNERLFAPNGQPLQHGRVLYSSGEDHIAKVVEPRMQLHAVDRSRLEYIKGLPDGQYVRLLDVVEHCDLLREALKQRPDTIALVLDPISSFQGGIDSNKVAQVRRFTAVLTQLSEEFNIAIIGIHHFNKGKREVAGDAISGSHAYRDAARSIWLFALDGKDPTRRLMVCDKHNWAEQRPLGLAYRIENGVVHYEAEPLDMTSDELLSQSTKQPMEIACSWLLAQLSAGPQPAINVQIAATLEHIAERTLNRAKKHLGVVSTKENDRWMWSLPETADEEQQ